MKFTTWRQHCVLKMSDFSKIKKHCVCCGKKETKQKPVNTRNHCEDCRSKYPEIKDLSISDESNLSEISFGDFKNWLTGTIQSAINSEISKHIENFNTDIHNLRDELSSTKKDLAEANNKIGAQNLSISTMQNELDETTSSLNDVTKYLVNFDRNSRQHNVVIFGVPENELLIKQQDGEVEKVFTNDNEKIDEILKTVECHKKPKQYYRLGRKGDRQTKTIKNYIQFYK